MFSLLSKWKLHQSVQQTVMIHGFYCIITDTFNKDHQEIVSKQNLKNFSTLDKKKRQSAKYSLPITDI